MKTAITTSIGVFDSKTKAIDYIINNGLDTRSHRTLKDQTADTIRDIINSQPTTVPEPATNNQTAAGSMDELMNVIKQQQQQIETLMSAVNGNGTCQPATEPATEPTTKPAPAHVPVNMFEQFRDTDIFGLFATGKSRIVVFKPDNKKDKPSGLIIRKTGQEFEIVKPIVDSDGNLAIKTNLTGNKSEILDTITTGYGKNGTANPYKLDNQTIESIRAALKTAELKPVNRG